MTRVGVLGAGGRMGRLVCKTVAEDRELRLVAAVDPSLAGREIGEAIGLPTLDVGISASTANLTAGDIDVLVDFTTPDAVMDNVRWSLGHGVHVVVGTTGMGEAQFEEIRTTLTEQRGRSSNVVIAPNFAIGAVLLQDFAARAARFFPAAEIIELHHDAKLDAPSGTALATARKIASARREKWLGPASESVAGVRGGEASDVRVHSVRLPGLVAHQEVIFGGVGQTLTLRHDSVDRASFMPGVILAVKSVASRPGLTVGLEPLLGLQA